MLQNYLVRMMKTNKLSYLTIAFLALNLVGCSSIVGRPKNAEPLKSVSALDLNLYLGKWYEVARFPNSFEKNCVNVTAEYKLRDDGKISVLNSCYDAKNPKKLRIAKGVAEKLNEKAGVFAVNFAPFPLPKGEGNYHVIWVANDYSRAIVGEPKGKYLWFLSRDKFIKSEDLNQMKEIAKANSYDLNFLEIVTQN